MNKDTQVHFGSVRVSFSGDIKSLQNILNKFNGRNGTNLECSTDYETHYFCNRPFRIGGHYGQATIELFSVSDHALTEILKIMANDKGSEV